MTNYDQLHVLWRDPRGRSRRVIGRLWMDKEAGYCFGYDRTKLPEAEKNGFVLLPEFPVKRYIDGPYESRYLFSTFAQRIPSPKRPDYGRILTDWAVRNTDNLMEILSASGGAQATDALELSEYRSDTDDLSDPLLFQIAATNRYDGAHDIKEGDRLGLQRDAENAFDKNATKVMRDTRQVGWIPSQYAPIVARLLDLRAHLELTVERRIMMSPERIRVVARIHAR